MAGRAATSLARDIDPSRFPLVLYKRILRLHKGLPAEVRSLGDTYVKDEWRRHKDAAPQHALLFLKEWTEYCTTLSRQLSHMGIAKGKLGRALEEEELDQFKDEQLRQLLELKLEAKGQADSNDQK